MANENKRTSILDGLKAGEVILSDSGKSVDEGDTLVDGEPGTGTGNGAEFIDPAEAFGPDPDPDAGLELASEPGTGAVENDTTRPEQPRSSGGAPRGRASPNYGRKAAQKENISFIESLLVGIHTIGATIVKDPTWEITEDEAKKLAEALANVQAQYDLTLDPKTEAWIKLMGVAGSIYGPRIVIPMMAKRALREEQPKPDEGKPRQSGGVVQMRPVPTKEKGQGPGGAFVPSQMMPMGWGSGAEDTER